MGDPASGRTHKTALVAIPPEAVWPPIQAIRSRHDRHYCRWMPHITLLYPFRHRSDFPLVARQIEGACRDLPAFDVALAAFRFFGHRSSYTLWLAPEPSRELAKLHSALWRAFPDCDETRRYGAFTPHLSVGQVRGRERLDRLLADLGGSWTPLTFRVSEISLIWRSDPPDDVFRVARRFRLGTRQQDREEDQ